ncbi:unnamed protein product [Prorocentrum cordatum]|uniref:Uncharacterized protein n=1 Tax=Prorocentrum cordatum TaxID=2364126 RepID=A0ABN9V103_9DINO|nr:unnamed protein product [Polarella glacialis]
MMLATKQGDDGVGSVKGLKRLNSCLGGGLSGVGSIKDKMLGVLGKKVDEAAWRSNLSDTHRVRNMARTLWLSLEHTNEAVMRVALEIVTCRRARKILWWDDERWSQEEGKQEYLRSVIEEKFDTILQYMGKELKERSVAGDLKGGPSSREVELEKQNGDLQRKLRVAELSLAEAKRLLEQQEEEAAQLRRRGGSSGSDAALAPELERLEAELREKNSELEAVLTERAAELERARAEAGEASARGSSGEARAREAARVAARAQLQAELDELQQKNHRLQAEVDRNSGASTCSKCGTQLSEAATAQEAEPSPKKSSRTSARELQEGTERKDAEIARLRADKKKLEAERVDMLALIDRLRRQINKMRALARESGHGDLVDKVMEESELAATMESDEMSCFARLYQDALRRMANSGSLRGHKDVVRDRPAAKPSAPQQVPQLPEAASPSHQLQPLQRSPTACRTVSPVTLDFGAASCPVSPAGRGRPGGSPADTRHAATAAEFGPGKENLPRPLRALPSSPRLGAPRGPGPAAPLERSRGGVEYRCPLAHPLPSPPPPPPSPSRRRRPGAPGALRPGRHRGRRRLLRGEAPGQQGGRRPLGRRAVAARRRGRADERLDGLPDGRPGGAAGQGGGPEAAGAGARGPGEPQAVPARRARASAARRRSAALAGLDEPRGGARPHAAAVGGQGRPARQPLSAGLQGARGRPAAAGGAEGAGRAPQPVEGGDRAEQQPARAAGSGSRAAPGGLGLARLLGQQWGGARRHTQRSNRGGGRTCSWSRQ